MANVQIEARPKILPEGSDIPDYQVEDHVDHVLGAFKTKKEPTDWPKASGHRFLLAPVGRINNGKYPDQEGQSCSAFSLFSEPTLLDSRTCLLVSSEMVKE
jgi:hypothetical protein